jgi:quinol monooxygenase YgiN
MGVTDTSLHNPTAVRSQIAMAMILFFTIMLMSNEAIATPIKPNYLAQEQTPSTTVKVSPSLIFVIHVDVMPQFAVAASELLTKYRRDSLRDVGVKRIEVLQQVGHPNHFTIVEEWDNQDVYDAHISGSRSREFRTNLQPMLGSPFDERSHHALN